MLQQSGEKSLNSSVKEKKQSSAGNVATIWWKKFKQFSEGKETIQWKKNWNDPVIFFFF